MLVPAAAKIAELAYERNRRLTELQKGQFMWIRAKSKLNQPGIRLIF